MMFDKIVMVGSPPKRLGDMTDEEREQEAEKLRRQLRQEWERRREERLRERCWFVFPCGEDAAVRGTGGVAGGMVAERSGSR